MNYKNLTIATKMNYLLVGMLAALGVLLAFYLIESFWQASQTSKQEETLALQVSAEELYVEFLALRQTQSEYMAAQQKLLPDGYVEAYEIHKLHLDDLLGKVPTNAAKELLNQTASVITEQTAEFDSIVSLNVFIGEDEFSGIRGELRDIASNFEKDVRGLPSTLAYKSELLLLVIDMQRYEKEFMMLLGDEYAGRVFTGARDIEVLIKKMGLSAKKSKQLISQKNEYTKTFAQLVEQMALIAQARARMDQQSEALKELYAQMRSEFETYFSSAQERISYYSDIVKAAYGVLLTVIGAALSFFIWRFGRDIIDVLGHLSTVMDQVNKGDLKARTKLDRHDELGQVGSTFDRLLDERITELEESEALNNQLNESIIEVIQRVGRIANQKDFTIKVPVASDVTGTISDSINLLVNEVSEVLREVVSISNYLEQSSQVVVSDAEMVVGDSGNAREQVENAVKVLDDSMTQLDDVSQQSSMAAQWADNTIGQTQEAFEAVTKSVENINSIRDTISETEKRIKRLGERSQEITGIVNLINNIAERTHILALNASMHAASAGEAGRGFAVVADEVQRLAENAREATAEISTLVNNIHVETSDTVTIMNTVISQVAEGTRLADQAGNLMTETKVNTAELVSAIKHIAEDTTSQVQRSDEIKQLMMVIEKATRLIDDRLAEQKRNSDSMAQFAAQLVGAVQVFTLVEKDS